MKRIISAFFSLLVSTLVLLAESSWGLNLNDPHVPSQLIIKVTNHTAIENIENMLTAQGGKIIRKLKAPGLFLVSFTNKQGFSANLEAVGNNLLKNKNIKMVEANHIYKINDMPNDPLFSDLWAMHNAGELKRKKDADLDALEAWSITTGSPHILVGIFDTGIDYTHEDLIDNIWTNPGESGTDSEGRDKRTNGIDDDGNGYIDDFRGWDFINDDNDPMDDHSHGTHVAGTIGASGNNNKGVVGINWQVGLVAIKMFNATGTSTAATIIDAFTYGNSLKLDVSNNSWGGSSYSAILDNLIGQAHVNGTVVVAAAGNSRNDNDTIDHYPSSYHHDNVIAVAATDSQDALANFSNHGTTSVHVAAPGVNILSTVPGHRYEKMSGTSMATPHITGLVALIKGLFPNLTPKQIKNRLIYSSDHLPGLEKKSISKGRVNALASLEDDNEKPSSVNSIFLTSSNLKSINIEWDISGDDGDQGRAYSYQARISSEEIVSEEDWKLATPAITEQVERDQKILATISDLPLNFTGYISVRAIDNVGNVSDIGSSVYFATTLTEIYLENDGHSLEGTVANEPWGIEKKDENSLFSDSPGTQYENNKNISITFDKIKVPSKRGILTFSTSFDIESGYDNGYFELSIDNGETWNILDTFTGKGNDQIRSYHLSDFLSKNEILQWRFRLKTDSSITKDGWKIDNIRIHIPASEETISSDYH